jgi:L-amino acid N-acyltransferase YncA
MPEPVDINAENIVLAEKYNRNGFFPYIVLLNKNGRVLGKTGYEEFENAKEYLFLLKNL